MPKVCKVGKFRVSTSPLSTKILGKDKVTSKVNNHLKENGASSNDSKHSNISQTIGMAPAAHLSKGQKKRHQKRAQYLKRNKMVMESLRLRHVEDQRNRMDGLDEMREAICSIGSSATIETKPPCDSPTESRHHKVAVKSQTIITNKAKKIVGEKEVAHLNLVLQHPSFQNDPFGAIQEHLRNTIAVRELDQTCRIENSKQKKDKEVKRKTKINTQYNLQKSSHKMFKKSSKQQIDGRSN
mmetsp:Transcript_2900/g.3391  ORF Transcript_2900/g.3391 Transcript_2900/m.3391 type:complete len:240 (-) Transcript_2900:25-744(-)